MGVVEEVGELSHALLKQEQGIRGAHDEHERLAQDAVGDTIVYLADLCTRRGWDLSAIVEATWAEVSRRDWKANPATGESVVEQPEESKKELLALISNLISAQRTEAAKLREERPSHPGAAFAEERAAAYEDLLRRWKETSEWPTR
jgi:NTP pyrophosphatase (non-canonical NTP hydrolase)